MLSKMPIPEEMESNSGFAIRKTGQVSKNRTKIWQTKDTEINHFWQKCVNMHLMTAMLTVETSLYKVSYAKCLAKCWKK